MFRTVLALTVVASIGLAAPSIADAQQRRVVKATKKGARVVPVVREPGSASSVTRRAGAGRSPSIATGRTSRRATGALGSTMLSRAAQNRAIQNRAAQNRAAQNRARQRQRTGDEPGEFTGVPGMNGADGMFPMQQGTRRGGSKLKKLVIGAAIVAALGAGFMLGIGAEIADRFSDAWGSIGGGPSEPLEVPWDQLPDPPDGFPDGPSDLNDGRPPGFEDNYPLPEPGSGGPPSAQEIRDALGSMGFGDEAPVGNGK